LHRQYTKKDKHDHVGRTFKEVHRVERKKERKKERRSDSEDLERVEWVDQTKGAAFSSAFWV
jgi:hypothetical protein